jgi:hypothetical protein
MRHDMDVSDIHAFAHFARWPAIAIRSRVVRVDAMPSFMRDASLAPLPPTAGDRLSFTDIGHCHTLTPCKNINMGTQLPVANPLASSVMGVNPRKSTVIANPLNHLGLNLLLSVCSFSFDRILARHAVNGRPHRKNRVGRFPR